MVNDSVAIILFNTVFEIATKNSDVVWYIEFEILGSFIYNCFCSIATGAILGTFKFFFNYKGMLATWITKKIHYI